MTHNPSNNDPNPNQDPGSPAILPKDPKVSILGLGQMGLVMASTLVSENGDSTPRVTLWGHTDRETGDLLQTRRSPKLPEFELPSEVKVALSDESAVAEADLIVVAVPAQFIREALQRLAPKIPPNAAVLSVAKGVENQTLLRPTQVIAEMLNDDPDGPPRPIGALSGPTIATELARCLPATMIAASDRSEFAADIQRLFSTSWMRVYTNHDTLGVELAGATKNVIAIAAGILDGLQAGYNAKSALLARGLAEIARLGAAMGASPDTFFGIAGVGDLATTCFSPEGRNRSLGEALGKGANLEAYLEESHFVVEGVATTKSVVDLATKYRVDMPITRAVFAVLFDDLDPLEAITRLMSRDLKSERVG